jgi:hypothetical protein
MFFTGTGLIMMVLTWRFLVAPEFEKMESQQDSKSAG